MQKHKYLAIAISIVVGGLWIALVMYTFSSGKTKVPVNPGVTAVSSAHQSFGTNTPTPSFKTLSSAPWSLTNNSAVVTPEATARPQATMGSTSYRLHQTSSATAHVVGSGTGSASGGITSVGSSSSRGIHSTALAYSGTIYIPMVNNAITSVGAKHADELVNQKMGIVERRRIKHEEGDGFGDLNDGPVLDPPTPVGDIAWGLMILLAVAYATMRGVRRARREEK